MTRRAFRAATAGAIIGAVALTGCSSDGGDDGDSTSSSATAEGGSPSAGSAPADGGSDGSARAAGIDPANPPKSIASLTLPAAPDEGVTSVEVDLVQLARDGKVVKAVFGITPTFDSPDTTDVSMFDAFGQHSPRPQLLDTDNLKLYKTVPAGPGSVLESDLVDTPVSDGKTSYYWAILAAPPTDVSRVNVIFGIGPDLMMDVPIS